MCPGGVMVVGGCRCLWYTWCTVGGACGCVTADVCVVCGAGNATAGNTTTGNSTAGNSTTRGHSFNVTVGTTNMTVVVVVSTSSGNLTVQMANTTVPSRVLRTDAGACVCRGLWEGGCG